MVAEQKQTVEERRRTMLPRDAVKKSASLSPLIRQNKLTPSHAASINEGLSNALVTQSKPDLELKIARSAVRAGPLYLRECAMVALHRDRGG